MCYQWKRKCRKKIFFLPSALSNLLCGTNSSLYLKKKKKVFFPVTLVLKKSPTFTPPIFFHNKTTHSQVRVKLSTALNSRALSSSRRRVKAVVSISPPRAPSPLPNSKGLFCFLQRQDGGGFKVRKGLPRAVAEGEDWLFHQRPFSHGYFRG